MPAISRGLDLPIAGRPEQTILDGPAVTRFALVGPDFIGMKPTMEVTEGTAVRLGQILFTDKKTPGVQFTAPASGTIVEINRGAKRVFQSLVIETDAPAANPIEFPATPGEEALRNLSGDTVIERLVDSGMWIALRTRPFNRVPALDSRPRAIFVTAMDTHPLAGDPEAVIRERREDFVHGLRVLTRLTDGTVYVCHAPGKTIPGEGVDRTRLETFSGPHPAGLPGTHMHFLEPVGVGRVNWFIGYQDVIAYGRLFRTGELDHGRVVSLAGPSVRQPCLIRTHLGASLTQLTAGRLESPEENKDHTQDHGDDHGKKVPPIRVISGSVLCGREAVPPMDYLGRYHNQITALPEGTKREFLGWQGPGFNRFSILPIYASSLFRSKRFAMTTNQGGSKRALVPVGSYELVMPLDILPTQLLKSLIVGDSDTAQQLGALELDEDDIALCTFVCPGKYEYPKMLRETLTRIEREG